jgi:arylsulfatase A-like enzyme
MRVMALALLLFVPTCSAPTTRPDVVLIVMDTTRADHLSVYGYKRKTTPSLDRFAEQAVVYTHAWSTSSWTLPSHASLLTGRYVTAHGAHMRPDRGPDSLGDNPPRLSDAIVTLAELLSAAGYRTAAFAGAGWLAPEFGLLQGYAVQDAENLRSVPAEELTDRAIAWLEGVPRNEPAHLLVNYFDPHWPYKPPKGFDTFPGATDPVDHAAEWDGSPEAAAARARDEKTMKSVLARYDGEILYTDHHIGRLLDALRRLGRFERSLIVVVADHGESLGERGLMGHGAWLYEPLLRIPFIVRWPGGRDGGTRVDDPVSIVDVAPIVAGETGIILPADVDGVPPGERTLVIAEEVLFKAQKDEQREDGGQRPPDRDLLAGIRWPLKLIVNMPGPEELFHLDADPDEENNLADGKAEVDLEREVLNLVGELTGPEPEAPQPMSAQARERLKALGYIE